MPSLWIIDAYNFIRQSRRFAELEAENGPKGKAAALRWLGRFHDRTGERVCLVFDAYSGLQDEMIRERSHGLTVLASRGGYTADEEIMAMVAEKGEGAIVVSSDKMILEAAIKAGASILKSEEFEREVGKILDGGEEPEAAPQRRPAKKKGEAFRPPKEKKKALALLRKYQ